MTICATDIEYKQSYDARVKAELSVAPYISLIGSLENPSAYMGDFENITYKFFDFARALDVCFKSYYVFNLAHPEACEAIWDFLNRQFYGLPGGDNRTKPATYTLLNNIKGNTSEASATSLIFQLLLLLIICSGFGSKTEFIH